MSLYDEYGYYWVKLNEPDGSAWVVAQFIKTQDEAWDYWNKRTTLVPIPQNYWRFCGNPVSQRQVQTEGASNRWVIGPKIEPPE